MMSVNWTLCCFFYSPAQVTRFVNPRQDSFSFVSEYICRTIRSFAITMSDLEVYDSPKIGIALAFIDLSPNAFGPQLIDFPGAALIIIWRRLVPDGKERFQVAD